LRVSPRLGYGAKGFGPFIPPNATLLYEIELLRVE
jgi:FKBP-type peptidyl-prolyl cis-trans isomerase